MMKKISIILSFLLCVGFSNCSKNIYKGNIIEFESGPEGFNTRTFFYEAEKEVVAIDSQFTPDLAKKSIEYLRKYTSKPITWLIITHPNPDKFNGSSVFKKAGAKILSSENTKKAISGVHQYKKYYFTEMAKMFKKNEYPEPSEIDETFKQSKKLVLQSGEVIELKELKNPGVSSNQTVVYIKNNNALFVGDLIHSNAHAWLEGGIVNGKATPTIEGWIADLKEIEESYPLDSLVYGGRGLTLNLKESVEKQITYLDDSLEIVRAELKSLGSKANDFTGKNSEVLYKNLTEKFVKKFPDYKFPYMIEYGVYGLVLDELGKINKK